MDRHLALLHFDRLEVVLHCGGQVWCYLFVNHHLDISTFVCLFGRDWVRFTSALARLSYPSLPLPRYAFVTSLYRCSMSKYSSPT